MNIGDNSKNLNHQKKYHSTRNRSDIIKVEEDNNNLVKKITHENKKNKNQTASINTIPGMDEYLFQHQPQMMKQTRNGSSFTFVENSAHQDQADDVDYFMSCTTSHWVPGISGSFFEGDSHSHSHSHSDNRKHMAKVNNRHNSNNDNNTNNNNKNKNINSLSSPRKFVGQPLEHSGLASSSSATTFVTPEDFHFTKCLSSFSFLSNASRNNSMNSLASLDTNHSHSTDNNNISPLNSMYPSFGNSNAAVVPNQSSNVYSHRDSEKNFSTTQQRQQNQQRQQHQQHQLQEQHEEQEQQHYHQQQYLQQKQHFQRGQQLQLPLALSNQAQPHTHKNSIYSNLKETIDQKTLQNIVAPSLHTMESSSNDSQIGQGRNSGLINGSDGDRINLWVDVFLT